MLCCACGGGANPFESVADLRATLDSWIQTDPSNRPIAGRGQIEEWDVSGLTDLSHAFCAQSGDTRCNTIRSDFNANISKWTVSQVTSLESSFEGAQSFVGQGMENWNVENVVNFNNTFTGCT